MENIKRVLKTASVFLVLLVLLSVSVYALDFDHSWQEDGNTYLGTFHVKDMRPVDLELWKSFMTSPRLFAEQDADHNIYFFEVPEGVSGKIVKNPPGSVYAYDVQFSPTFPVSALIFSYRSSTGMYELVGSYKDDSFRGFGLDAIIVNRGFPLTSAVPASELYIDHPGALYIVDDLGNEMEGEGDTDDGTPWWRHLLDWLDSFWKKLKNFFVPDDNYFSDWFTEIKNAAMKKLKPISEVHDYFKGAFDSLKSDTSNTGLYLEIPKNHFFEGSPGVRANILKSVGSILGTLKTILTMVCVVFTAICCYRRIIDIFEQ